jgi:hypothetical protein
LQQNPNGRIVEELTKNRSAQLKPIGLWQAASFTAQ